MIIKNALIYVHLLYPVVFFSHFIAVYVILCVLSRTKVDIAIATFIFKQQVLNETQVIQKIVDNRT